MQEYNNIWPKRMQLHAKLIPKNKRKNKKTKSRKRERRLIEKNLW